MILIPEDLSQMKRGGSRKFPSSEDSHVEQITTDNFLSLFSLYISPSFVRFFDNCLYKDKSEK